jgi:hypothetical protein
MPPYSEPEMTLLRRARVEDFEEVVVTRPRRDDLDRAFVRELVEKLDLLRSETEEPTLPSPSPKSPERR